MAQSDDSIYVIKSGVDFHMPPGFQSEKFREELNRVFDCGDGKVAGSLAYMLSNKEKSITIGISINKSLSTESTNKINLMFKRGYKPNENYILTAKHLADTTKYPLIFYDDKVLLKKFNADDGGVYMRNCNRPFLEKYRNHLILFIFKRDFGHVEITYFFNEDEKGKVDEMLEHAYDMIQFNKSD